MRKLWKVVAVLFFTLSVAACGGEGDSETNGTLTLTAAADVSANTVTMTATAVLTPVMTGSDISFTTQLFNSGGAIPFPLDAKCSGTRSTDVTGTATISCNFPQPTVDAKLQVSATSGGLAAIPVSILIPGVP